MADEDCPQVVNVCHEVKELGENFDSITIVSSESTKVETEFTEDSIVSRHNTLNIPVEQLTKIAEVDKIEDRLEKELERKHQQELLEHILRQKEEMRELEKQLKLEVGNETNLLASTSQNAILNSRLMSQMLETDKNEDNCEGFGGVYVKDVRISQEHSNASKVVSSVDAVDEGGSNIGMSSIIEQEIARDLLETHELLGHSLDDCTDEELASILRGIWQQKNDILSNFPSLSSSQRMTKLKQPEVDFLKRPFSSYRGKRLGPKFNGRSFKTEICRSWSEFGYCPYGQRCRFAHGINELRIRPSACNNFKTARCKKFIAGYCQYGTRCRYVHDISETRMPFAGRSYVSHGRMETPNWACRYGNNDMNIGRRRWTSQSMAYHQGQ